MTSDEIKKQASIEFQDDDETYASSVCGWLKEIAYQFAKQNELQQEMVLNSRRMLQIQEDVYADKLASAEQGKRDECPCGCGYPDHFNDKLADPQPGKRDAESSAACAAVLRSCAKTIEESCLSVQSAVEYLRKYAETCERQGSAGIPAGKRDAESSPARENSSTLASELASLLNRHSLESCSNTPDFVLARFLVHSLAAFHEAINSRESHYGRPPGVRNSPFSTETGTPPKKEPCKMGEHQFDRDNLCKRCFFTVNEIVASLKR